MNVISSIFDVFEAVIDWLVNAVHSVIPMFYISTPTEGQTVGLTFLGVLAVVGLGISVCFLLIGIVQKFLHFAG